VDASCNNCCNNYASLDNIVAVVGNIVVDNIVAAVDMGHSIVVVGNIYSIRNYPLLVLIIIIIN